MALRFRLKGLAETFIERIICPACGVTSRDESRFSTELTRVTFDGIIVISQCETCGEIFVPSEQRFGVINSRLLQEAVVSDGIETGEALMQGLANVRAHAERLNAERKGDLH